MKLGVDYHAGNGFRAQLTTSPIPLSTLCNYIKGHYENYIGDIKVIIPYFLAWSKKKLP